MELIISFPKIFGRQVSEDFEEWGTWKRLYWPERLDTKQP